METLIVWLIIAGAAWFIGRRLYRSFRQSEPNCSCGNDCANCTVDPSRENCSQKPSADPPP